MPPLQSRFSAEQKAEIVARYSDGETLASIAEAEGVSSSTIQKIIKKAGGGSRPAKPIMPVAAVGEFAKRARSILWRQTKGTEKKAYDKWQKKVDSLVAGSEMNRHQATIQASKDFSCLKQLFTEFNVKEYDPHPESHPDIKHWGETNQLDDMENEGIDQSHRKNLAWAIEAAGKWLRTSEKPVSCPNDSAYYLFCQAKDDPKDFLAKYNQIQVRSDDESEEARRAKRTGQRAIDEIDEMLSTLDDGASPGEEERDDG